MKALKSNKIVLLICLLLFGITSQGKNPKKQIDNLLKESYSKDSPGIVVMVKKSGKEIYKKAFGMSDTELDIPMKTDMVFQIGSVTKQFTAVSILMLMEQRKLNLDDDITKFIEDYPTNGNKITIHHLLTHTSGIKDFSDLDDWDTFKMNDYKLIDLINIFKNEPINFKPGEGHQYCNSGYILLGSIIEKISGQTYENFIVENIFKPLEMTNSYYGNKNREIENRVTGYQKKDDTVVKSNLWSMSIAYAAGALMSTAEDLSIWNQALIENKLISNESLKKAYTNYTLNNGDKIGYGYGWFIEEMHGTPNFWHGGHIAGFITWEMYFPEDDVYIAILSNCSYKFDTKLPEKIAAIALNKPIKEKPEEIEVDVEILKQYVGVYNYDDTTSRYIKLIGNKIYYQKSLTGLTMELFASSENTFFRKKSESTLEFTKDDNGIVKGFLWNYGDKKEYALKTANLLPQHNVVLDIESLEQFVGRFERKSELFDFELHDNHLMMKFVSSDDVTYEIFPQSENTFIAGPLKVEFSDDKNTMTFYHDERVFVTQRIE